MAGRRTLRLFVACAMPEAVKRGLASIQDDMRRQGAPRLRYVRPEGIHITLKFLGDVQQHRVEAIAAALERAIEPFELRLTIERLGGFAPASLRAGSGAGLRVVWAALAGDLAQLAALAERVECALVPLGFPREKRLFAPHITLARVPDEVSVEDRLWLAALVESYQLPALPPMILSEVLLIRSILGPGGSVYEHLGFFPADPGEST